MASEPTALAVYLQRSYYDQNEGQIPIQCYGSAYSGSGSREGLTYTISILHHPVGTSQNPEIDAVVDSNDFTTDNTGQVTAYWNVRSAATGKHNRYYVKVSYNSDAAVGYSADFVVLAPDDYVIYELDMVLADLQRIPIRNEISLTNMGSSFRFASRYWRDDSTPVLRLNNRVLDIATEVSSIDYENGTVNLVTPQNSGTTLELESGYRKLLDDSSLRIFLEKTLGDINLMPPETRYELSTFPGIWRGVLVTGAQAAALNAVIGSAALREQVIMLVGEGAISSIQSVATAANAQYEAMRGAIKKRSLAGGRVVTSHDTGIPPRITSATYQNYLYMRFGR